MPALSAFLPVALLPFLLTAMAAPPPPSAAPPVTGSSAPAPVASGVAVSPAGSWRWPLTPEPLVVHRFWVGPAPWSPGHRGVDLAAVPGAAVLAPAAGVVRFAGTIAGRGVLTVDHGDGAVSSFEPVAARARPGTTVRRGQPVAVLAPPPFGASHCSPATCLHWGVRVNGQYVDPLAFLADRGPAVLLPLGRR